MTDKELYEAAQKALKEKGQFSNRTTGISMLPLLRANKDIIIIKPPVFPLKKNDVALYCRKDYDKLILHRIIKNPQNGVYVIRGDNTYVKEYVNESDIVGVLDGFFRSGRYVKCSENRFYSCYIFLMYAFYPVRYCWKMFLRPVLGKIKRRIFS